ncbi:MULTISPECIES: hypothetical protein [Anoxybacillaceae]|jgi:hypothetical protein|uniref:Uncharacterized protein n=1 Tax=Parageobacillus thermantarcticus TaxID=186116 RepID=A0A1I0T9R1_9BACL|nr:MULTISPECIES: hypothetical protein [Bacillaceae]KQB91930.1 hypothetical protein GEPA3_3069 [Geobacillus sp. PA-3]SFA47756.1 hypothetical protein SAMN05192569_101554 [Parageobacillus thermantarcticus]
MIINLDDYREKKKKKRNDRSMVSIPIFSRITVEDNKLIGELENGQKVIIQNLEKEE